MSVSVPSDYFLRRVLETSAGQSTSFAQQVGASRSPLLRNHSLLAPRELGTHPLVATYEANAG